jgi:DNA-directed RNA polymerase specialized sigma24 family protein
VLGIPQNTAASRYRLALARLRAVLGGDDDGR